MLLNVLQRAPGRTESPRHNMNLRKQRSSSAAATAGHGGHRRASCVHWCVVMMMMHCYAALFHVYVLRMPAGRLGAWGAPAPAPAADACRRRLPPSLGDRTNVAQTASSMIKRITKQCAVMLVLDSIAQHRPRGKQAQDTPANARTAAGAPARGEIERSTARALLSAGITPCCGPGAGP